MPTQFRVRDLNDGEYPEFFHAARKDYKAYIRRLDANGVQFRTGTAYDKDGDPVKKLTVLKRRK